MATGKHGGGWVRRKNKGDDMCEKDFGLATFVIDGTM